MCTSRDQQGDADPAGILEHNLPLITHLATTLSRRGGLPADCAEEYVSWSLARLIYDDYAVLRKFRGGSKIRQYLTIVLARYLLDFRNQAWGRWRPSAAALRMGPAAMFLERLIYRDRLAVREACEFVRRRFLVDPLAMYRALPRRWRPVQVPPHEALLDGPHDKVIAEAESREELELVTDRLRAALAELDPEDLVVVRLLFWEERTVAEIARQLNLDPKRLYRRVARVLGGLRRALEKRGVDLATVRSVVDDAA